MTNEIEQPETDAASIRVTVATRDLIRRAASVRETTMGDLVRDAVAEYVARHPVTVTA